MKFWTEWSQLINRNLLVFNESLTNKKENVKTDEFLWVRTLGIVMLHDNTFGYPKSPFLGKFPIFHYDYFFPQKDHESLENKIDFLPKGERMDFEVQFFQDYCLEILKLWRRIRLFNEVRCNWKRYHFSWIKFMCQKKAGKSKVLIFKFGYVKFMMQFVKVENGLMKSFLRNFQLSRHLWKPINQDDPRSRIYHSDFIFIFYFQTILLLVTTHPNHWFQYKNTPFTIYFITNLRNYFFVFRLNWFL